MDNNRGLRILMLEDVEIDAELAERVLRKGGIDFTSKRVEGERDFLESLGEFRPDLVLADYRLPSFDGLKALAITRDKRPETPFIFVTGTMGEDIAIETLKKGATDYVLKTQLSRLCSAVRRALEEAEERTRRKRAEEELNKQREFLLRTIEALTHPFYVIDAADHTVVMSNSAAGLDASQRGIRCYEFTHRLSEPCWKSGTRCPLETVRDTKKPVTLEHVHNNKDGSERIDEIHGYPVLNDAGDVVQMIEYTFEITARKKAEEEMSRRMDELERFRNATIQREFRIKDLRDRVKELEEARRGKAG